MFIESFDIAPFALPNPPVAEVRFEEPRDIVRVEVEFASSAPNDVGLSYLRKTWPQTKLEFANHDTPCFLGWAHQDDWFNGEWQKADVAVAREDDRRVTISFSGLRAELPDAQDYDVTFRRALAIRVDAPDPNAIRDVRVFTTSPAAETRLRVELDAGRATQGRNIGLSGYNVEIESLKALDGVACDGTRVSLRDGTPRRFEVAVRHMIPTHRYCGDDGLVTFALDDDVFTISLVSLEREGPVWCEHLGCYIARADDPTTFEEYRARNASGQTISQRVRAHPEQCLPAALYGQPRPQPVSYNLGCARARQRFWLESNGDLVLHKSNVTWVAGKDTPRFKNNGSARFYFGLEKWAVIARHPDPAPVLAYTIEARQGTLTVEEESFAVPLLTPILADDWAGDDPMAALVRFTFRNDGDQPVEAALPIAYSQDSGRTHKGLPSPRTEDGYLVLRSPLEKLSVDGDRVFSAWEGADVLRCVLDTTMKVEETDGGVVVRKRLKPGASCKVVVKVPYLALDAKEEFKALDALEFDACHRDVAAYWRRAARASAHVQTPVPELNALHLSHVSHVLVTDFEMPDGSGLINTSVGTSTYGNFSNESCMIVHDLDERGLREEARRRLGIWVKYQSTVEQPGNFTDYDGMYFGAGGFESGAYNQHHGWVLWCLCEHYFLTGDEAWFRTVADSVIAGADWVFRQRRNTMKALPHSRGWEHGFLPAGSLEDVTDFYYWLSTNSLTWRGTDAATRALEAVAHPEAARLRREADAYRADLVRGFETMRQQSPLVRLRDGRWVPHYPSRLYRRGRELGWIRETLEGAVYLLISGLYDLHGPEAAWILDDYQDNRYMSPPYGYSVADFDLTWFDRGGLSIQPNLLAGLLPYLERDDPELYIWMFYNAWAACYREEINAMVEHPMPILGYSNAAHFKTSDEANAMAWLRYMLVYPFGDTLYLGRAIPRRWLGQPEPFEATGVATPFGEVSVRYEPAPGEHKAKATVDLALRKAPGHIMLRFRTPEGQPLRAVSVNGREHPIADPAKGDIEITGMTGKVHIAAEY